MSGFAWRTSALDERIRSREDDYSVQFSEVGNDLLFLRFDKLAPRGEVWISDLNFLPRDLDVVVRAFEVAAYDFDLTIADRVVRMPGLATLNAPHSDVVAAYDEAKAKLSNIFESLGRQIDDCILDLGIGGKYDLVVSVS